MILGQEGAVNLQWLLMALAYLSIALSAALGTLPQIAVVSLLSIPLGWQAHRAALAVATKTPQRVSPPTYALATYVATGLLMAGATLWEAGH